jgi:hypothetical protein
MKRRFSFVRTTNCWLFVAALLVTGRIRGVALVWDSPVPHAMALSRHGRFIHIRRSEGRPRVCSLWLKGQPEVFNPTLILSCPHRVWLGTF